MNRDPRVFWHRETQKWVMALYLDKDRYGLFTSPNLKDWEEACRVTVLGSSECPDMFELPVDEKSSDTRWVFWAANGRYLLGTFDGHKSLREEGVHQPSWGDSYAAQTWNDAPNEQRVQIAWLKTAHTGMPFSQNMTISCKLTLRKTEEGVRLFGSPVQGISKVRLRGHVWKGLHVTLGQT